MVSILLFCQYMEPNVFVFSTKKKEVDSSAPLKKSDFKPFAGLDNMRDPGILDPRHFFPQALLHDLRDFYMIFTQFSRFLRNFA